VIRLVVMMYVRFPLSLRNVEDLLFERGIDICHETVLHWWNRFEPMFAGDIRRQRVSRMRGFRLWRWHIDEMYVKLKARSSTCGERSISNATSSIARPTRNAAPPPWQSGKSSRASPPPPKMHLHRAESGSR
jgi:hypothetical protein